MSETLLQIWNNILTSNLFNFVVMLFVLGWIIKKFDIAGLLEKGRKSIEDNIQTSKDVKKESLDKLYKTQEKTKEIDEEVFEILNKADKNATIVGEKLVDDAKRQATEFDKALQKTIDGNIKALNLNLSNKTAEASVQLAKKHIEKELENNKDLHMKFINESIDALNGVKL